MPHTLPTSGTQPSPIILQLRRIWGSLFLRTFFLIALLLFASLGTWIQSVRIVESTPKARQVAAQAVSIVKLTHAALQYSAPEYRHQLLVDLERYEGIRIYPRENKDQVEDLNRNRKSSDETYAEIKKQLGEDTVISSRVNDQNGLWISFKIAEDDYWVVINRERLERFNNLRLAWWAIAAVSFALMGAAFISAIVNYPLKQLAKAANALGNGESVKPLPEYSDSEVSQVNRSFNQLVNHLTELDSDRAVMLAGISHDLRTPLARLRLETEMSPADASTKEAMNNDITQMDNIINQFMEYAKATPGNVETIDLSNLVAECLHSLVITTPNLKLSQSVAPECWVRGNRTDLQRVLNNLIDNARNYGISPNTGDLILHCSLQKVFTNSTRPMILLQIADQGIGVPEANIAQLTRPFFRFDNARSNAKGTGLGLAIVQRLVKRLGGSLEIFPQHPPLTGLIAEILLPANELPH